MNKIIVAGLIILTLCMAVHVQRAWGAEAAGVESGGTMMKRSVKVVQPGADVQVAPQSVTGQVRRLYEDVGGFVRARASYGYGGMMRNNCCLYIGERHGSISDMENPLKMYCVLGAEPGGSELCSALEEAQLNCMVDLRIKAEPYKTIESKLGRGEDYLLSDFDGMGLVIDDGYLMMATLQDPYVLKAGSDALTPLDRSMAGRVISATLKVREIKFYKIESLENVMCRQVMER